MSYIDKYKNRVRTNGEDLGEAYSNNTIAFIESTFASSPTFRRLKVESYEKPHITEMDARVVEVERLGTLREVLFRPTSEDLNEGTYIKFDNFTWLIYDTYDKKALVAQCNKKLKWYDKEGKLHNFDCIASASDVGSKAKQSKNEIEWNKYDVNLPVGQLFVFVEYRPETEKIDLGHRFLFGRNAYEIIGVDDNTVIREIDGKSVGVIQFIARITTKNEKDNFETGIAYNHYKVENIIITEPKTITNKDDEKDVDNEVIW